MELLNDVETMVSKIVASVRKYAYTEADALHLIIDICNARLKRLYK